MISRNILPARLREVPKNLTFTFTGLELVFFTVPDSNRFMLNELRIRFITEFDFVNLQ